MPTSEGTQAQRGPAGSGSARTTAQIALESLERRQLLKVAEVNPPAEFLFEDGDEPEKVDPDTRFQIASVSKYVTGAAIGTIVDEGKLKWETKVTDIIPEFRLYNSYVTEDFNIKDLLTHRSGMGLGAGDLMLWPDSSTFTKEEIIHNLRYLKQTSSFRTKYVYDNLLYLIAGEVADRDSGQSWE